jgi:hypothetical protein
MVQYMSLWTEKEFQREQEMEYSMGLSIAREPWSRQ